MQSYHLTQWVLFFFIYSFIGWVWECCFVSVRKRRWVNRGFMYGPMLPIYGFGALAVLISTIRVRDSIPLIFLFGMVGATLLEYVTGAVMERLFNVKYWDYSNQKFNLNGYICLTPSFTMRSSKKFIFCSSRFPACADYFSILFFHIGSFFVAAFRLFIKYTEHSS